MQPQRDVSEPELRALPLFVHRNHKRLNLASCSRRKLSKIDKKMLVYKSACCQCLYLLVLHEMQLMIRYGQCRGAF